MRFAVINQTSPNLQGSCRNKSWCCLQNYMENGWELTSELTSNWVTFNNTQSNFAPISLITFAVINHTSPNLQGSCRNTSRWCLQNYMGNGVTSAVITATSLYIWRSLINVNFAKFDLLLQKLLKRLLRNLIEYY